MNLSERFNNLQGAHIAWEEANNTTISECIITCAMRISAMLVFIDGDGEEEIERIVKMIQAGKTSLRKSGTTYQGNLQ